MPAKILLPPNGKHGSAIIGENGSLRVVDQPKRCKGYQNCCHCTRCIAHEAEKLKRPSVATCECDRPMISEDRCFRCGKSLTSRAA